MPECGQRAVLVVTRAIEGTSTNVARRRVQLRCRLSEGHAGPHHDTEHDEHWEGRSGHPQTLLQHEDDEPAGDE
jgi:hypothetical protein